ANLRSAAQHWKLNSQTRVASLGQLDAQGSIELVVRTPASPVCHDGRAAGVFCFGIERQELVPIFLLQPNRLPHHDARKYLIGPTLLPLVVLTERKTACKHQRRANDRSYPERTPVPPTCCGSQPVRGMR